MSDLCVTHLPRMAVGLLGNFAVKATKMKPHQFCLLGALFLAALSQQALAQKRMLFLLPDANQQDKYSTFLDSLKAIGFTIDVKAYKDSSLSLKDYDTWHYDHLALFCPKAEGFGGSLDLNAIVEFIDSGRNVLLAANSVVSDTMRALAAEVGVEIDEKGTKVFDHFYHAKRIDQAPDHNLIAATDVVSSKAILPNGVKGPVLFRGVAATVPADSQLVTVALSAPATAYSNDPRKTMQEPPALMAGSSIALVSLVQARNNARVLVAGSTEMFQDSAMDVALEGGQRSGNKEFVLSVARWTLQEQAVIKAENLRHRLLSEPEGSNPWGYRVMDDVEFAVDVFEYEGGVKKPYKADDMQVEFTMLDPHVRLPLQHDGNGTFSVRFKVPDVYGVFKYVVSYVHRGYSYIELTQQVPVRPFKHNEYERFLVCAYPYYASVMSGMVAFFALGWFYLYHK